MKIKSLSTIGIDKQLKSLVEPPLNNPYNLPGMCSHLIEFIDYLQKQGFIH